VSLLEKSGLTSLLRRAASHGLKLHFRNNPHDLARILAEAAALQTQELVASLQSVGEGLHIEGRIHVTEAAGLVIGNNVHIGDNAFFFTRGGLTIGDNTHISRNVTIHTSDPEWEGRALPHDSSYRDMPVVIGRNVWIGMNVNIAPGARIGDGAVIGMGAAVCAEVPPGAIVGPAPHQVIRQRDEARYRRLDAGRRWGGVAGRLLDEKALRRFHATAREKGDQLFFVVGTGRSGSTSIANTLSRHSGILCLHEPKLQLVRLSTAYAHGQLSREQVAQELLDLYQGVGAMPAGLYGESDQKLSNLIEVLADLFPRAKFIWLIRDPVDAINSMASRGWFSENEMFPSEASEPYDDPLYRGYYSEHRVRGDRAGAVAPEEWRKMSLFERSCWYWSYWNALIERQLAALSGERWKMVRLEDLANAMPGILEFLGAPFEAACEVTKDNVAEGRHALLERRDWTPDQAAAFDRWCLANARRWYANDIWPQG
jgi:acetyltransferase-like isoleucine patch superfamily enzyme